MSGGRRGGADQWRGGTARGPAPRCLGARRRAFPLRPPARPPARRIVVASPPPPSGYLEAVTRERFPRGRGRGRGKPGRGGAGRAGALSAGRLFVVRPRTRADPRGADGAGETSRGRWMLILPPCPPATCGQRSCLDLPGRLPSTPCRVTREPWLPPGLGADGTPVSPGNKPGSHTKRLF